MKEVGGWVSGGLESVDREGSIAEWERLAVRLGEGERRRGV